MVRLETEWTELAEGYANGLITDKEFTEMCDIILMDNTTVKVIHGVTIRVWNHPGE